MKGIAQQREEFEPWLADIKLNTMMLGQEYCYGWTRGAWASWKEQERRFAERLKMAFVQGAIFDADQADATYPSESEITTFKAMAEKLLADGTLGENTNAI